MNAPLTPPECDLKEFPFTPIFRSRLFGSEFHANATDAEWRAGVTLWLKSWDQVPAGSLPKDDIALCRLAELGRDMRSWKKVKDRAMRGWDECSDGRLYHPVVAQGVTEAWKSKLKARAKGKAGAEKRWGTGNASANENGCPDHPEGIAQAMPSDGNGHRHGHRHGQGEETKEEVSPPAPLFEEFWNAYPTDKIMSKPAAAAQWAQLSDNDKRASFAAVPGFKAFCAKDKTYRPVHACRFLSERRFDGFAGETVDPAKAAENQDRADRLMRRGKYAEQFDEAAQ
jgi:hypothetical protein